MNALRPQANSDGSSGTAAVKYTARLSLIAISLILAGTSAAQELRYSWMDLSFMVQDFDRMGTQTVEPVPGVFQTVDVDASDGDGVRFRGSLGTWNNLYLFVDYGSTDVDFDAVIDNPTLPMPELAQDLFDYTTIRGGVGVKWSIGFSTDIYAQVSFDSLDLDWGSLGGENFDADKQDVGGSIGVRTLLGDDFEIRVHGRFTNVGDVDLNTLQFDSDTLFGAGFGWELVRGLSIVGDYEAGEFSAWSVGFRLDLDED